MLLRGMGNGVDKWGKGGNALGNFRAIVKFFLFLNFGSSLLWWKFNVLLVMGIVILVYIAYVESDVLHLPEYTMGMCNIPWSIPCPG